MHQGESAILESFLHFCLLRKKGNYSLVFIALVSIVHSVQPRLVRNWPVNHLCVCGSQAPHFWEILKLCLRRIRMWGWDQRGLGGGSGCSWRRHSFLLPSGLAEAAAMALSSSQAWICPIAATQSRGIRGGQGGNGCRQCCAGTLFLCFHQEFMLLEIRHDVNIYTLGIGRQYKPRLPTPKLTVQHFPAHHCIWILDSDCPLSILLQRGYGRGHGKP